MNTHSSADVCAATGVTYRQLDYWTRLGHLEPIIPAGGSGTRRRWSDADIAKVKRLRMASMLRERSATITDALDLIGDIERGELVLAVA